ncbi:MAG: hypothetical protein WB797_12485 [Nocardioides sp.]
MESTLSRYYRAIDEDRIDDALAMLHERLSFVIVLPTAARRGHGRADMGGYLSGRGVPGRRHALLRESRDGDLEFAYGKVTEGAVTTGRFLAAVRVGPDGLIASYQVTFDVEHDLLEDR